MHGLGTTLNIHVSGIHGPIKLCVIYTSQFDLYQPFIKTCTLDVLMHLPRSVFSHRQLELFIWLLKVNNVDDVPSVASMMELNSMLQKLCGIESIAYDGALGHRYYVNSLSQIIAQVIDCIFFLEQN